MSWIAPFQPLAIELVDRVGWIATERTNSVNVDCKSPAELFVDLRLAGHRSESFAVDEAELEPAGIARAAQAAAASREVGALMEENKAADPNWSRRYFDWRNNGGR